jgi:hypothetical protein
MNVVIAIIIFIIICILVVLYFNHKSSKFTPQINKFNSLQDDILTKIEEINAKIRNVIFYRCGEDCPENIIGRKQIKELNAQKTKLINLYTEYERAKTNLEK